MHMLFLLVCSFVQHEVVSSALSFVCELGFIVVGGLKLRGTSWIMQCRGRCVECDLSRRTGEPERRCQPALKDVRHTVDRAITKPQAGVREAQRDHSCIIQCGGRWSLQTERMWAYPEFLCTEVHAMSPIWIALSVESWDAGPQVHQAFCYLDFLASSRCQRGSM